MSVELFKNNSSINANVITLEHLVKLIFKFN